MTFAGKNFSYLVYRPVLETEIAECSIPAKSFE